MRQIISFNNKNVILPEPWVPSGPADDELWYTSSDGNIVTPNVIGALPTIISNTYENGKGIIKCDSTITNIGTGTGTLRAYAFQGKSTLKEMIIPNTVTEIGSGAYRLTGLTEFTIPNNVIIINSYAFSNCTKLMYLRYNGTMAMWNNIYKGNNWHGEVTPVDVVHWTDGDVAI